MPRRPATAPRLCQHFHGWKLSCAAIQGRAPEVLGGVPDVGREGDDEGGVEDEPEPLQIHAQGAQHDDEEGDDAQGHPEVRAARQPPRAGRQAGRGPVGAAGRHGGGRLFSVVGARFRNSKRIHGGCSRTLFACACVRVVPRHLSRMIMLAGMGA